MELVKDFIIVIIFIIFLAGICSLNDQVATLKSIVTDQQKALTEVVKVQGWQAAMMDQDRKFRHIEGLE